MINLPTFGARLNLVRALKDYESQAENERRAHILMAEKFERMADNERASSTAKAIIDGTL